MEEQDPHREHCLACQTLWYSCKSFWGQVMISEAGKHWAGLMSPGCGNCFQLPVPEHLARATAAHCWFHIGIRQKAGVSRGIWRSLLRLLPTEMVLDCVISKMCCLPSVVSGSCSKFLCPLVIPAFQPSALLHPGASFWELDKAIFVS